MKWTIAMTLMDDSTRLAQRLVADGVEVDRVILP